MTHARVVAKNTAVQLAGKAVSIALGIAIIAMLTRLLGPEGFGLYSTIIALMQLGGIIVDMGLALTIVQLMTKSDLDPAHVAGNVLALRLVSAVLLFAAMPFIAFALPYDDTVSLGAAVAIPAFAAAALVQVIGGIYQRYADTRWFAIGEVIGRIVLLGFVAAMFFAHGNVLMVLAASGVATIVNLIVVFFGSRKFFSLRLRLDWEMWRVILKTTWPIAIGIVFNLVYLKADTVILSLIYPAATVGIYAAAYRVLEVLIVLPMVLLGLVLPLLSQAVHRRDMVAFAKYYQGTADTLAVLTFPLVAGGIVLATPIMSTIAGANFAASGQLLKILMIAIAAIYLSTLPAHAIVALNLQKRMLVGYAIAAIGGLVLYLVTIPRFGAIAAAWDTVIVECFIFAFTSVLVARETNIRIKFSVSIRALVASIIMGTVLTSVSLPLVIALILGMIVYVACAFALRIIHPTLLRELFGRVPETLDLAPEPISQ